MTIETKYNIGDEVWFLDSADNVKSSTILNMQIYVFYDGDLQQRYNVLNNKIRDFRSYELFPTKQELLESL